MYYLIKMNPLIILVIIQEYLRGNDLTLADLTSTLQCESQLLLHLVLLQELLLRLLVARVCLDVLLWVNYVAT